MSVYDQKLIPSQMQNYCAPPHWDANAIFRYSVPQDVMTPLPITPRPYAKVNLEYRTSAPFEQAPRVPDNFVVQGAANNFPPQRYIENIDAESALERLDRPLNRDPVPSAFPGIPYYLPDEKGDLFNDRLLLNPQRPPLDNTMAELEVPKAIRDIHGYQCYSKELACDVAYNNKLWFNPTKLQKYNQRDNECGARYDYTQGQTPSASRLPKVWDDPTD